MPPLAVRQGVGEEWGMTLWVRGLRKRFGAVEALRGVTFRVPEGATWGLLGPNGSGKTTTMRILLGIVPPDAGEVTWQGRPVAQWPRSLWGYLPEERGLYPKLPVREQLTYLARLQGLSAREAAARADRWLRRLAMEGMARRRLEQLSKGNQQKIQFAAAVLHDPAILLLDEPFSGLDPGNAATLKQVLEELRGEGRTVLFSSHRLDHVRELCDGITLVHDGRVVLHGTLEEVVAPFREPRIRVRLARPLPADAVSRLPLPPRRVEGEWLSFDLRDGPQGRGAGTPSGAAPWQDPALADLCRGLLDAILQHGPVVRFEWEEPDLEAIYIRLTGRRPGASTRPEGEGDAGVA
ncbi:MAG TPA: ATP-binding cassette domain-containing protein [Thermaerobacter sp.]